MGWKVVERESGWEPVQERFSFWRFTLSGFDWWALLFLQKIVPAAILVGSGLLLAAATPWTMAELKWPVIGTAFGLMLLAGILYLAVPPLRTNPLVRFLATLLVITKLVPLVRPSFLGGILPFMLWNGVMLNLLAHHFPHWSENVLGAVVVGGWFLTAILVSLTTAIVRQLRHARRRKRFSARRAVRPPVTFRRDDQAVVKLVIRLVVGIVGLLALAAGAAYAIDAPLQATVVDKECNVTGDGTLHVKTKLLGIETTTDVPREQCLAIQEENFIQVKIRTEQVTIWEKEGGRCIYDSVKGVGCGV